MDERMSKDDLLDLAWGLIANSYGGDWKLATPDWRKAAKRWQDGYLPNRIVEDNAEVPSDE